jgi:hypothetical protein
MLPAYHCLQKPLLSTVPAQVNCFVFEIFCKQLGGATNSAPFPSWAPFNFQYTLTLLLVDVEVLQARVERKERLQLEKCSGARKSVTPCSGKGWSFYGHFNSGLLRVVGGGYCPCVLQAFLGKLV